MLNIDTLFLYTFIFSILVLSRTILRFISSLLTDPPQRLVLSNKELIFLGLTLSYILTYIIKI